MSFDVDNLVYNRSGIYILSHGDSGKVGEANILISSNIVANHMYRNGPGKYFKQFLYLPLYE